MPDVPESPSEREQTPVVRRALSRRWFVAAIIASALCAIVIGLEFADLLSVPSSAGDRESRSPEPRPSSLTVAVARTPGGPGEWSNWARIIKALSDQLDTPLTVRYLSKEDEAAKVIAADKIDIAFVCAHHYVDLTERGVCDGVATPIINGSTMSTSQLVVRAADSATGIDDLAGSVVAVSDKSSLGGYAYLSYLLQQDGRFAADYFSELRLGETQEQNLRDVLGGDARATVINSAQAGSLDLSGIRVIEQSVPFGCPPVVVRSDMDPELRTRILNILVGLDLGTLLPPGSAIEGFEKLDPAEYEFALELRGACGHHAD
ncbi:MAG: PhnD/SsuA/transferrin family substrate-binding protein, partial [Actinomycetota bacterium]|nr:PhnD/SsuA/transferrin family substrate-binding protein [Actinomycetota bacterium]